MRFALFVIVLFAAPPAAAEGFEDAIAAAERALRHGDYDEAIQQVRSAKANLDEPAVGGPRRYAAELLLGRIARAKKDHVVAARRFRDAAHAALDDRRARSRALSLRRRALFAANERTSAKVVSELMKHDQRLRVFERYPRRSPKKRDKALRDLDRAADAYRADRDRARVDQAKAVRALVLARSGEAKSAIAAAEHLADAAAPRARAIAAQALYYARVAEGDTDGALAAAVRFNRIDAESVDERRRIYFRTRELDAACKKYEADREPGACARAQLDLAGAVALTDYSKQKRSGRLSQQDLERAHHEGLPWLERCVLDAAKKDPERFAGTDLTISWVVGADGEPTETKVKPSRYAEDLQPCLRDVVGRFRYPRVRNNELSSVAIPYSLD